MKMKKHWVLTIASAICVGALISVSVWASADEKSYIERIGSGEITVDKALDEIRREPLVGLEGVMLIVAHLGSVEKQYGLTEKKLQTDVELRLRQSGIKILEPEEWGRTLGKPQLIIWVRTPVPQVIANDSVIVDVHVEISEDAVLLRDPRIYMPVVTWKRNWLGPVATDSFEDYIRGFIKDSVDIFCNDYLAANQKEMNTSKKALP